MENALPKYRQEFPDFDYLMPNIPGLTDTSWHNNASPSFAADDAFKVELWCNYRDKMKGGWDETEVATFMLFRLDSTFTPQEAIIKTEDIGEAVKAYLIEVKKVLTGPGFFRAWLGEAYQSKVGYNPFDDDPKMRAPEVVDLLAGVIAEEFRSINSPEENDSDFAGVDLDGDGPEFPEVEEMVDAITSAEAALAEAHKNCVGNDRTEGEGCDEESIFFAPLVLCRGVLTKIKTAQEATS